MRAYKRRVQKIGKNTFVITLPSSWAREIGLDNKSEVLLEVLPDMSLRVYRASTVNNNNELVAEIRVNDNYNEHDVAREIIACYIAGVTHIKIAYGGVYRPLVDRGVNIARERLIGLEVIDEDANAIVLQVVVDPNLRDIESVVKRLKRITISMHRDILRFFLGEVDSSILDSVIARDSLADKLYLLALRQLAQVLQDPYEMGKKGLNPIEAIHRVMFIKSLERVADHAVNLAKTAKAITTIPSELVELYRETIDVFDAMADALISMDKQKAIELVKQVEKLRIVDEEIRKSIGLNKELSYHLSRILDIISRILARTIDAEEIVVDINAIKTLRKYAIEPASGKSS